MKRTETIANPGGVVPYGPYNAGDDLDEVVGGGRAWAPRPGKEFVFSAHSFTYATLLTHSHPGYVSFPLTG